MEITLTKQFVWIFITLTSLAAIATCATPDSSGTTMLATSMTDLQSTELTTEPTEASGEATVSGETTVTTAFSPTTNGSYPSVTTSTSGLLLMVLMAVLAHHMIQVGIRT